MTGPVVDADDDITQAVVRLRLYPEQRYRDPPAWFARRAHAPGDGSVCAWVDGVIVDATEVRDRDRGCAARTRERAAAAVPA